MFGYIKIAPDHLKGMDNRAYRKMYCGLCHQIGEYSQMARMSLSFDMAFFLILSSYDCAQIADQCVEGKCLRHIDCPDRIVDYWAGVSVMMIWHKFQNDYLDGEKIKQGVVFALNRGYQKAAEKFPAADGIIRDALQKIAELEKEKTDDAQAFMTVFGNLARELVNHSPQPETRDPLLRELIGNIASEMGAWIYCMDFYDDLDQDQKKKQYNPLLIQAEKDSLTLEQARERFRAVIDGHVAELQRMCAFLPYDGFQAILLNVLHEGVISVTSDVYAGQFRAHRGR